jgi:hypothetical protein
MEEEASAEDSDDGFSEDAFSFMSSWEETDFFYRMNLVYENDEHVDHDHTYSCPLVPESVEDVEDLDSTPKH